MPDGRRLDMRVSGPADGLLFFGHYEPRVRDNEQRAQVGRPFRGGPVIGR